MVAVVPILVGLAVLLGFALFLKMQLALRDFKGISVIGWMLNKKNPSDVLTDIVRADPEVKFLKFVLPGFPSLVAVHPESIKVRYIDIIHSLFSILDNILALISFFLKLPIKIYRPQY